MVEGLTRHACVWAVVHEVADGVQRRLVGGLIRAAVGCRGGAPELRARLLRRVVAAVVGLAAAALEGVQQPEPVPYLVHHRVAQVIPLQTA